MILDLEQGRMTVVHRGCMLLCTKTQQSQLFAAPTLQTLPNEGRDVFLSSPPPNKRRQPPLQTNPMCCGTLGNIEWGPG